MKRVDLVLAQQDARRIHQFFRKCPPAPARFGAQRDDLGLACRLLDQQEGPQLAIALRQQRHGTGQRE
jgi:hypothetical protein